MAYEVTRKKWRATNTVVLCTALAGEGDIHLKKSLRIFRISRSKNLWGWKVGMKSGLHSNTADSLCKIAQERKWCLSSRWQKTSLATSCIPKSHVKILISHFCICYSEFRSLHSCQYSRHWKVVPQEKELASYNFLYTQPRCLKQNKTKPKIDIIQQLQLFFIYIEFFIQ